MKKFQKLKKFINRSLIEGDYEGDGYHQALIDVKAYIEVLEQEAKLEPLKEVVIDNK